MASWYSDGAISGFSAWQGGYTNGAIRLASTAMVDANGQTRLQYPITVGTGSGPGENKMFGTSVITITAGDISADPTKQFGTTMFVCNAAIIEAEFGLAPGTVPTADQMRTCCDLYPFLTDAFRSGSFTTTAHPNFLSVCETPTPPWMEPDSKYWVLVLPTKRVAGSTPSVANDIPISGSPTTWATLGRGVSMWSNRTPRKPTIVTPTTGSSFSAGEQFRMAVALDDPDAEGETFPYLDFAGYEIQYRAQPTDEAPSPAWGYLQTVKAGALVDGWEIIGASATNQSSTSMILARTLDIDCANAVLTNNTGVLPSGAWEVRLRVFDYGHPYAPDGTFPLGDNTGAYTAATYPAENTSPWSDSINIFVSQQVPAPVATNPRDSIAVINDGTPVKLEWTYFNTHNPPYPQASRKVQIRKVGDAAWTTLTTAAGSDPFYVVDGSTVSDNLVPDPSFESGISFWESVGSPTKVWSTAQARSGTHSMETSDALGAAPANVVRSQPILVTEGVTYTISSWVWTASTGRVITPVWYSDAAGTIPINTVPAVTSAAVAGGWHPITSTNPAAPAGAQSCRLYLRRGQYHDDISMTAPSAPFVFVSGNQYEWRVQVTDSGLKTSDWSNVARFWMVAVPASGDIRPIPADTIDGATLGCGTHRVFVYRRGGSERVGELRKLSHVDWERKRDDISTAEVHVSDWDIDCGNLLSELQTWAYEIVIFRDNGYSSERVWEGPITLLTYEVDKVTIQAKDVMGYAYRRIIKQAISDAGKYSATTGLFTGGATVVARAKKVLLNAFAPDDPNVIEYMKVLPRDDDAMQYRSTPAYARTAFEEVDDMAANSGLDYTVTGRSIIIWGTKHRIGTLPEFRDADLGSPPIVSEYGMSFSNRYAVTDGNGAWGEADHLDDTGVDPIYGLVEMLSSSWASDAESDSGTYTEESKDKLEQGFKESSEASIADRYPPPVIVRIPDNTTLNPGTVLSIQHLVPGVAIPLRSTGTLRSVVAMQKLDSMKVVEEEGSEVISITLSPLSLVDVEEVA